MSVIYVFCFGLLILLVGAGVWGLLFFKDYVKRICCLSVSYMAFLVFFALLAFRLGCLNEVMVFAMTLLVMFAINLFVAIGLVKGIDRG